ncbi:MAG: recombinase family protein [Oscillospiraceae bacterium]|nr:recombinase family protein [Oscillospiraceae bacterium]
MPKITKIQAPAPPPSLTRAAAYSRVSDGKDAMLHSLSAQVSYYSALIQSTPGWQYIGTYADAALTGTKEDRPEFQRLLRDCRAGKIDVVLTKSISRFARNTVTLLETVRELKSLGVDIFFQEQNIHTMSGDGELMLTVLASYAQAESLSVSENCNWRIRKQFAEGKPTHSRAYGYLQEGETFTIIPEEAAVVRQIFVDYLSGMGILAIQKKLLEQGINFSKNGLAGLLRNEKYTGDLRLQKTYTQDHLSKRKVKNIGQLPQYLVSNNHPAIIDRATFDAVKAEIARRAAAHKLAPLNWGKYELTGKIRCGICGAPFGHKIAGSAPKYKKAVWSCHTYNTIGKAHCASQQIPDDILQAKVAEAGGMEGLMEILVPGHFQLIFAYEDGRRVDLTWRHPSRRDSWTPEMKDEARRRNLK